MRVKRGQGALEYLILIGATLAIVSAVVLFSTGVLGGQKTPAQLNACRQAAAACFTAKLAYPNEPCTACETACLEGGKDILSKTLGCGTACMNCKAGASNLIYEGAYSAFQPFDRDFWTSTAINWSATGMSTNLYSSSLLQSPANIGTNSTITFPANTSGSSGSRYAIPGEKGNLSKRPYFVVWVRPQFATHSEMSFSVQLETDTLKDAYVGYFNFPQAGQWYKVVFDYKNMTKTLSPNPERITHIHFQLTCSDCYLQQDLYVWAVDNMYFSSTRESQFMTSSAAQLCGDGTPYGECSAGWIGLICQNGVFASQCSTCGCPPIQSYCCSTGTCAFGAVECIGGGGGPS